MAADYTKSCPRKCHLMTGLNAFRLLLLLLVGFDRLLKKEIQIGGKIVIDRSNFQRYLDDLHIQS